MNDLPQIVLKYFWGDSKKELSWELHKDYITQTLLEKGDMNALRWLLKKADKKYLQKMVQKRLDPMSKNFWEIYLS